MQETIYHMHTEMRQILDFITLSKTSIPLIPVGIIKLCEFAYPFILFS